MFCCDLPPVPLAEWPGSLRAAAVTWGGTDTEIRVSTENSPAAPAGTRTRDFFVTSPTL